MEETQDYIKGFNQGYKIAKYKPELLAQISEGFKGVNDYEKGFLEGVKELQKEKEKGRTDDISTIRKSKDQSKDRDLSR